MNLVRLIPKEDSASAAARQFIICLETGVELTWNQAARLGWFADLDGPAYRAYYSPEGLKQLRDKNVVVNQIVEKFLQPAG